MSFKLRDPHFQPYFTQISEMLIPHLPHPLENIIMGFIDIENLYVKAIANARLVLRNLIMGNDYTTVVDRIYQHTKLSKPIMEWLKKLPMGQITFERKHYLDAWYIDLELNGNIKFRIRIDDGDLRGRISGSGDTTFVCEYETFKKIGVHHLYSFKQVDKIIRVYAKAENKPPFLVKDLTDDTKTRTIIDNGYPIEILVLLAFWDGMCDVLTSRYEVRDNH